MKHNLDDMKKLIIQMDGDSICITGPNFENLQLSPAIFFSPNDWQFEKIINNFGEYEYPILNLPIYEISKIMDELGC